MSGSPCRAHPFVRRGPCAFSLIEVVLAIGIVSFAFLTLLALVPIGLNSEKTTVNETSAVNLMNSVVTDLAATPLVNSGSPTTNTSSVRFGFTLPVTVTSPTSITAYITENQQPTNAASAQYRVVMHYYPANMGSGTYAPPAVLIQISWPAEAASTNAQGVYESYATFPPSGL